MKQIIKQLSIKFGQIFLPMLMITMAIVIGIAPFISAMVVNDLWLLLALIATIPVAITIIIIMNNTVNWYEIWNFDDLKEAIEVYKTKPQRAPYDDEHSTPD